MEKLNDLVNRQYQVADPFAMCVLAMEGFHHVTNFHDQAQQHSFTAEDFRPPIYSPSKFSPEALKGLKNWIGNPFTTVAQVTLSTDVKLQRFKAIKTQGNDFCGLRWRAIPEQIRRRLNDTFVELDKLEKAGAWHVSKDDRKKVAQTLKESEEEFTLMTGPP